MDKKENQQELMEQPKNTEETKPGSTPVTKLYDKLPFSLRQVDTFIKIMVGLLIVLLAYGILKGNL